MSETRLVLVFVVDGLRPDAITAADTPTLHRLRGEGVDFANSHAAVPTVTRVNAATLATGMQPGTHGIVGNQIYVPEVDGARAIGTDSYRHLLRIDDATGGRLVSVRTLGERLASRGLTLAAVSSGSTGSALLTNPRAVRGVGALVNGYFEPGVRVAWPDPVNEAILAKLGPAPAKGRGDAYGDAVVWTQRVLREYLLPEVRPAVVLNWLTEPDHTQHVAGVGSPPACEVVRLADREIARTLAAVEDLGLAGSTAVIVVSDHGFTTNAGGIDVAGELIGAGLKAAPDSTDVILASSGQAVAVHVAGGDRERIQAIARLAQSSRWGGVVFSRARLPGDLRGWVDGTFALEAIHAAPARRSPDLLLTFAWSSDSNAFGVRGTDLACTSGGATLYASDHGSMSPWNVRNTLFAWGAAFARGVSVGSAAGNADVAPTVLALLGVPGASEMEGRVLREALRGGPGTLDLSVATETHAVTGAGGYRAALQITTVDGRRYVDQSWRER